MAPDAEQMPPDDGMPGERSSLPDVLKRTFKSFQAHKMTDHAASLTYYTMMSLFPALLAMVAILGLVGTQSLITDAVDYARDNGAYLAWEKTSRDREAFTGWLRALERGSR